MQPVAVSLSSPPPPARSLHPSLPSHFPEFFSDAIPCTRGARETALRNESLKMLGRGIAGLTNEFRRGYTSRRAQLHFEVLSLAGNQPAWQMFAKTSTSRVSLRILYIFRDSPALPGHEERRRKMLSASILFSRLRSSSRYGEHELPRLKLCSRDSDYVLEFQSITFVDVWRIVGKRSQ